MKELVIGIDIGGTFTKFGFVDREGIFYAEGNSPTDMFDNVDDYIKNLIKDLKKAEKEIKIPYKIVGMGIGAPNGNYHKGTVENATNLKWKGIVPFAELMKKHYDVPIKLTNDANAAALGEMIYGGARGMHDFVMITLGTGLGSGIVVNGDLVYGHDGFAGELGHVNVKKNGRKCGCGNFGCLETYVSAPGIKRTVFELLASNTEGSELVKYNFNELTSEIIYEAAKRNDPLALKAFDITGRILGEKLADTVAHTSPEAIFLFGGLANAGDFILIPTKKYMEESVMGTFRNKVRVLRSGLIGKNAAILGSGALIWKDL
ncbi:MAG: ROK family protein [Bacteroidales bacterium]|nr:ROK family protein [Bacteroidales bacterium]